jgi:hypothetical protein
MMSSVIPARLQFQCGHAAMVTLPRIKGETATQRNDRVAREKSAALNRPCDFCAPAVEVVVNGNHLVVAEVSLPETVVAETELVAVLEPATPVLPVVVKAETEDTLPQLVVAEIEAEVESALEVAAVEGLLEALVEAADEVLPTEPKTPADEDLSTPAVSAKRRAPVTTRRVRAAEVIRGRRFLVEYRLERVVRAVDIHDALRQAGSLGASQLTAITRED